MSSKDSRKTKDSRTNAASRAAGLRKQQERDERVRSLLSVGGVIVVLALIIGGAFWFQAARDSSGEPAASPSGANGDYGVVVGSDSADTRMTLYEDFQCPACASFERQMGDKIDQAVEDGKVQVEYRMVSFLDQMSSTEYSSRAHSAAAVVLQEAGKDAFGKFHDLLFANQPPEGGEGLTDDRLVELAVEAGADKDEVEQPIRDQKFAGWAANATDAMSQNDVTGTPTVFIDGEKVEGNPVQAVQKAIG